MNGLVKQIGPYVDPKHKKLKRSPNVTNVHFKLAAGQFLEKLL